MRKKSGRLDLNQRPFGPQPTDSGVYVSRSVRRFLCVQGRGRSGQIGRCIGYQSGTTARAHNRARRSGEPSTTESCFHARATAPPSGAKSAALHGKAALHGGILRGRCRKRTWRSHDSCWNFGSEAIRAPAESSMTRAARSSSARPGFRTRAHTGSAPRPWMPGHFHRCVRAGRVRGRPSRGSGRAGRSVDLRSRSRPCERCRGQCRDCDCPFVSGREGRSR